MHPSVHLISAIANKWTHSDSKLKMVGWLNFLCPWYVIWSYLLFDNIYLFFIFHEHSSWRPEMWNVAYSIQMKNKKKSSTCCCMKYWNQTFEELLSTNGISSKLCALTVSPLFYPFPNFQQCGVLRLSKCITSPICGQPTNQPPPYITIFPEWSLGCPIFHFFFNWATPF